MEQLHQIFRANKKPIPASNFVWKLFANFAHLYTSMLVRQL